VKTSFLWSLYYLRKNFTYDEAINDIVSRQGDTRCNAAIVGGLIGAVNGTKVGQVISIESSYPLLLNIGSIV
jgi:ADP-ribosylglycohydrolase